MVSKAQGSSTSAPRQQVRNASFVPFYLDRVGTNRGENRSGVFLQKSSGSPHRARHSASQQRKAAPIKSPPIKSPPALCWRRTYRHRSDHTRPVLFGSSMWIQSDIVEEELDLEETVSPVCDAPGSPMHKGAPQRTRALCPTVRCAQSIATFGSASACSSSRATQ